jgi:hypothetical protein
MADCLMNEIKCSDGKPKPVPENKAKKAKPMRKLVTFSVLFFIFSTSTSSFAECTSATLMGDPKFPPYSIRKGSNYSGRSCDFVYSFLTKNNIDYSPNKAKGSKEYLLKKFYKSKNSLFIAYPSFLPERSDVVLSEPTDHIELRVLQNQRHQFKYSLPYSLQNKKGSIDRAVNLEKYLTYKNRAYLNIQRHKDLSVALQQLKDKKIDYIILEGRTIRTVMNNRRNTEHFFVAPTPLTKFTLHLAMNKKSDCANLLLSQNDMLVKMRNSRDKNERKQDKIMRQNQKQITIID